ncbi:hypothetical protein, partial [Chitinophaga sancti]|uniref:hypothetical protein n=1 Tax=Chitinophaga sancti TaxID=1004 RepID=UPI001C431D92
ADPIRLNPYGYYILASVSLRLRWGCKVSYFFISTKSFFKFFYLSIIGPNAYLERVVACCKTDK